MTSNFFAQARARYAASNAATLSWMLDREPLFGAFVNTKMNPLTLVDYAEADGWRGPDHLYGWIQGRGLEAVVTHAAAFQDEEPALSARLDSLGRDLYSAVDALRAKTGHVSFCYDKALNPIRFLNLTDYVPLEQEEDIYTYADIFAAKGLVVGAARYAPDDLPRQLEALQTVITAIEDGRFQYNEKLPISRQTMADELLDFGSRMIMLSAGALLTRLGRRDLAGFADRFIAFVIENHFDAETGLLRNVKGRDESNVGHSIEFVGFALDYLGKDASPELIETLRTILVSSFDMGFDGPGVRLVVSVESTMPTSPYCPWWTLPETIRSAALLYELAPDAEVLRIWKQADEAFFKGYWRDEAGIAYQCLTDDGPIDYVPATPDLDPGYHTGLSLLAAINVVDRGLLNNSSEG